jgi:hypothetical protein
MKYNGKEYEVYTEREGSCANCDFDSDTEGCEKVECPKVIGGWREVKTAKPITETVCATLRQVGDIAISQGGLTKREWFAGMALSGATVHAYNQTENDQAILAKIAFGIADAMIKAGKETE